MTPPWVGPETLEVDEAPLASYGTQGASKETGTLGSIVTKTIGQLHPQRNPQQHPQVGGDLDVEPTTTTPSPLDERFRRTLVDARTIDLASDVANAAAPATFAADAGCSPSPALSSYDSGCLVPFVRNNLLPTYSTLQSWSRE